MVRLTYPSFRLLLYLEWLLLATAVFMEVLLPFQLSWSLVLRVGAIAAFGLMSFTPPTSRLATKLFYTAVEFGLIWLAATLDGLSTRSVFLLCLVLVMRSCLIFKLSGQLVVLGLSLLSYGTLLLSKPIVAQKFKLAVWDWRFSNVLLFSLTLVFALLLINALLAERQSREQLQIAHQELEITHKQLREYALRIEDQATLQERNRIAREIHDGLGHTLAAQTIQINNALLFWQSNNDKALTFVKQAKQLGAEALLEIRRSVSVLRSKPLQGQSLESAIEKLLTNFQQTTGIKPSYKINLPLSLPTELNTTLYRIVQESLTNIYKHAQATGVTVELLSHAGMIHLVIEDNGKGFNPTQNTTGFGLQGMRERASALGGELNLHSQPGTGCRICVSFPPSKLLL
ncbi:integral membrane sensor signal transduction histidine kinase [Scytonema sp. HK-05]|uniref:sensor histidine kinase n=1 Tax=Scytonema sp. HK-05 TaxID=1137095 RepID=UPI000937721C|nr:sensor histidine kinase [Scytonema sp. HK-05]OKH58093.1 histidine kinase [Scytonema sp. HK-05]BAY47525.1 integral membrane sensor signal transduction histidine kinase [Scytonema sp. HK-05]